MTDFVVAEMANCWHQGDYSEALGQLLVAVDGKAAGAWRLDGDVLHQIAFVADSSMPHDIAQEFADATRIVPMQRDDLAIVQAMLTRQNFTARPDDGPAGSANWLKRFDAPASYCVPLKSTADEIPWGVIAIAAGAELVDERSMIRQTIEKLAAAIGSTPPHHGQ